MKRFLLIALTFPVIGILANATPITTNCVLFPVTFAGGVGTTTVSCPGIAAQPPGTILNSVLLTESSDYQFGSSGTNTVKVDFTPTGPAGVTWSPATASATSTGTTSSGAPGAASQSVTAGLTLANFASAFGVSLTSSVITGTVATSSGGVVVTYDVTPPTGVPEPTGMMLIGSGLLGLGLISFRKKKA